MLLVPMLAPGLVRQGNLLRPPKLTKGLVGLMVLPVALSLGCPRKIRGSRMQGTPVDTCFRDGQSPGVLALLTVWDIWALYRALQSKVTHSVRVSPGTP